MKPETIAIVKATAPVIQEMGTQITQRMYEIAFEARPDLRRFFTTTWMQNAEEGRKQAGRLAEAVYAYALHIDELDKLSSAVDEIVQRHVRLNITAEMYPVIGECLLAAVKDVLGDAATPEVLEAWGEAYDALADIFIGREMELYRERDSQLFAIKDARPQ